MGSSSPPPAPNYQPIADASRQQAEWQRQIAEEQLQWAKDQYADNKPYSDQVRQRMLETLDKNTKESDDQLARYKSLYHPVEDAFVKDVMDYDSAGRKEDQRTGAMAQVGQAYDAANANAERALEANGVDPSEVRSGALNLGAKLSRAAAQAAAGTTSDRAIDSNALALKANALGIGKGQPAQALGFQTAGTQAGMGGVQAGNSTTAGAAGSLGNGLGWSNAATNSIGTWGQVLNAGYQNQLAGFNASQNSSNGMSQLAGTAAGLGMMAMMAADGGSIPDEDEVEALQDRAIALPGYYGDDDEDDDGTDPMLDDGDDDDTQMMARGGTVGAQGLHIDPSMSPSGGRAVDDVPAVGPGGMPIKLNADEFVIPDRAVKWFGEKFFQNLIAKADKEAANAQAKPKIVNGAGEEMTEPSDNPAEEAGEQHLARGGMPRSMEAINLSQMAPHAPRVPSGVNLPHVTMGAGHHYPKIKTRTVPNFRPTSSRAA
jgi:hypothetical protein